MTMLMGLLLLLLISTLALAFFSTTSIFDELYPEAVAQQDVQTTKYRNLEIDLSNGVKTNAQLTLPTIGEGQFPAVLLVPGAGPADMNYGGMFSQIAQYLSERGFAVLRYDKRGVGDNGTHIDSDVWGNMTFNDLKQDAQKAVKVLVQQPEVDAKRITVLGHSEGGEIATRVAIDDQDKVNNIALMAPRIQSAVDAAYYNLVGLPLEYARQVLDKNHNGSISLQDVLQDQIFQGMVGGGNTSVIFTQSTPNGTGHLKAAFNPNNDRHINIDNELKPILESRFKKVFEGSKCENPMTGLCPNYFRSILGLNSTLSIISNISPTTGILILHGLNDSGSRVQQAFLLQQKLTELNHPDHILVTYADLGHHFYPSSQWTTESGSIPDYVLADLYSWLEAHSGLSRSYVATSTANTIASANTSSLNTNKTS
jgi:uncharacterized protein